MTKKKAKQSYRVTVYLGKKNYNTLKQMSDMLNIPVATIAKIMLDTGMQIGDALERGLSHGD